MDENKIDFEEARKRTIQQIERFFMLIDRQYIEFITFVKQALPKSTTRGRMALSFATAGIDAVCDIRRLVEANRNSSLENILRNAIESYAIFTLMYENFESDEFNNLVDYLYVVDLEQNFKIFKEVAQDQTTPGQKLEETVKILKKSQCALIYNKFPAYSDRVNEDEENLIYIDHVINIIKDIKREERLANIMTTMRAKVDFVGHALENNDEWKKETGKPYVGSYTLYPTLCRSAHNNVTSIIERTSINGNFVINAPTKNLLPILSCAYFCEKDMVEKLKKIL